MSHLAPAALRTFIALTLFAAVTAQAQDRPLPGAREHAPSTRATPSAAGTEQEHVLRVAVAASAPRATHVTASASDFSGSAEPPLYALLLGALAAVVFISSRRNKSED